MKYEYVKILEYGFPLYVRKEVKVNNIKDVQGIELMAGDKVAFFEVPRTRKMGKPFMAVGVIKKIHDHDDPLRNLTLTRTDNRLRYRQCGDIALIPDENEQEEGGGGGEPDENPKESQGQGESPKGGQEAPPQDGGPEATPKAGDSPTKEETDSGDGNPQKGGDSGSKGKTKKSTKDRLGQEQKAREQQAAFDKMMREEGRKREKEKRQFREEDDADPGEARGDGARLHFGVEYDFKTGETRKTKCECPQCRGKD